MTKFLAKIPENVNKNNADRSNIRKNLNHDNSRKRNSKNLFLFHILRWTVPLTTLFDKYIDRSKVDRSEGVGTRIAWKFNYLCYFASQKPKCMNEKRRIVIWAKILFIKSVFQTTWSWNSSGLARQIINSVIIFQNCLFYSETAACWIETNNWLCLTILVFPGWYYCLFWPLSVLKFKQTESWFFNIKLRIAFACLEETLILLDVWIVYKHWSSLISQLYSIWDMESHKIIIMSKWVSTAIDEQMLWRYWASETNVGCCMF